MQLDFESAITAARPNPPPTIADVVAHPVGTVGDSSPLCCGGLGIHQPRCGKGFVYLLHLPTSSNPVLPPLLPFPGWPGPHRRAHALPLQTRRALMSTLKGP
jgi:hypothetical protein